MRSGFFNSNITGYDDYGNPVYDRAEEASFFAEFFADFIGNGIYPNPSTGMQVIADSGMSLLVQTGSCFINGYRGKTEEGGETVTLEKSDISYPRIDRLVARLSIEDRNITLAVLKGIPASNPVAKSLTRNSNIFELGLADITVGKNVSVVTQANITDTRLNKNLCGIVTGVVEQLDTTTLFNQYVTWFSEKKKKSENEYKTWFDGFTIPSEQEFTNWFNNIKDILNEDVAIQLNEKIEQNTSKINTNTSNIATNTTDITNLGTQVNKLLNVQLYKNTSGTAGTVTLSQNANNFEEIVITCWRKNSHFFDCVVKNPNGKKVNLSSGYLANNTTFQINSKMVQISGNTITVVTEGYANITHNAPNAVGEQEVIYITEVVGRYKK